MDDGQLFARLMAAALDRLAAEEERINRSNTFPVPDGDSGTNMRFTWQAATEAAQAAPEAQLGAVVKRAARGALLAARGNSGIILSQILAGLAQGLADEAALTPAGLARAWGLAAEAAYRSVGQPVEGTILTAVRAVADAAHQAQDTPDLTAFLDRVVAAARDAVARTPELMPSLKAAGVVDAGALGLFVILEAMRDALRPGAESGRAAAAERRGVAVPRGGRATAPTVRADAVYGVEVQCLLEGENLDLPALRAALEALGDSVLVVGDERQAKVHVHTRHPQAAVDLLAEQGALSDLTFEDLDAQAGRFAESVRAPEG